MAYLSSDEMRITRCELALTHVQCVNLPLLLPRCQWRHRWIWFHVVIGAMASGVDGASGGSTGSASSILSVPVLILILILISVWELVLGIVQHKISVAVVESQVAPVAPEGQVLRHCFRLFVLLVPTEQADEEKL